MPTKVEKYVAYYRVSTAKQGKSGLGLDAQKEAVRDHLNGGKWTLVAEIVEVESGKRKDRPQLVRALEMCKIHKATLLIAKLDRLSRNVAFISNLMESNVEFEALDCPQASRLTLHIFAAIAEHEAAMTSQRTIVALAAAKRRGKQLGGNHNPDLVKYGARARKLSAEIRSANALEGRQRLLPTIEEIKATGIKTSRGIAEELNKMGISAPRGGQWSSVQVLRLQA